LSEVSLKLCDFSSSWYVCWKERDCVAADGKLQYKFVTITSTLAGFLAVLVFFPGLCQYISSSEGIGGTGGEKGPSPSFQNYSSLVVSTDPLLIYIFDFLSNSEIDHILSVTDNLFVPSRAYSPDSPAHRNSSSCVLPPSDPTHDTVIARSHSFLDGIVQQYRDAGLSYFDIEPLQLVRYGPSEYYHAHVDWFDALHKEDKGWKSRLYNRGASFFLYLEDGCSGGGTYFPEVSASMDETQLAALGEYMVTDERGVSFKPKKGNGLFWVNLMPDGIGDNRLIHAGLPVKLGRKVGMNVWVKRDFGW
jgi:prolyl 4-hydroxylase